MAFLSKATLLTAAAALLATATPAFARHRDHDGGDAAAIIAGALVIGGIAAIASSSHRDRYDDGYRGYRSRDRYGYNGAYGRDGYYARPRYRHDRNRYDRHDRYDHHNRHDRHDRGRAYYGY